MSREDVVLYSPGDPGYPDYVEVWTQILESGVAPEEQSFDLTETINLTRWTDADREKNPTRFRWYRVFTNSVAVILSALEEGDLLPVNYTVLRLLQDAAALDDEELFKALEPVFPEFHSRIVKADYLPGEVPFVSLAVLVFACMGHGHVESLGDLAQRIIDEESQARKRGHDFGLASFMWGVACFDQLHDEWREMTRRWLPEFTTVFNLALLRSQLLETE